MWNLTTKMIPVKIGASGTTSKSFTKYVINVPTMHEIQELFKKQPYWALHSYCGKY